MAIILIKEKKKEIGCVYAQKQTKGRGRYGRKWISAEGNLFGSIFFQLKKNYPSFSEFSTINPIIAITPIDNISIAPLSFKFIL